MRDCYWQLFDVVRAVGDLRAEQVEEVAKLSYLKSNRIHLPVEEQESIVKQYSAYKDRLDELDKALELMQQASEYL